MSDFLEKLFHCANVKAFAALAKELEGRYESPRAFLEEAAAYLPVRLYERYYGETAPPGLFGLIAAHQAQSLFPPEKRWLPLVQQCWLVTRERKRTPWDVEAIPARGDGSPESRWHCFQTHAGSGNLQEALSWAKGFLEKEEERKFFRERSLAFAMDDTALGGYKFLYLFQAWRLAELLDWKHVAEILFAPLHFIITGPKEGSLSRLAKDPWRRNPYPSLLQNRGAVPEELYQRLEYSLLFGTDVGSALAAFEEVVRAGAGLEPLRDALLLAAARALSNAHAGRWIWPLRAFHFAYMARGWMDLVEPHRKTYPLLLSAVLLHRAARFSRQSDANVPLDEVAQRLCPTDTFNVLRSVVSHSDPYASATAVYAILGMSDEKKEQLFETLAQLAVKNSAEVCCGNDILYLQEAVDAYRNSTLAQKDLYIVSAGFFLGCVHKKYDLSTQYGI